jgi:hypothetical protein
MKQNAVVTNFEQDFDADEKAMGRHNIDAASTALVTTDDAGLMSPEDKAKLDGLEPQQKADWNADRGVTEILNKPYVGKQFTAVVYEQDTFDDIAAKLAGGYNLILVGANGDFIGQYKYASSTAAIFEAYHIQPMRFVEYWCTADGWKQYTYYPTDMASPRVYTVDRVGTSYQQADLPHMSFDISSYFSSTHWQYQGADISGSIFDEFVSRKPQLVRYDYSTDLVYLLRGAPVGTPTAVATVELVMSYAATQTSEYVDEVQDWAPKIVIPFSDFTDSGQGTAYLSQHKPLNYSVTFDRQRFESLFASVYYAYFWLRCTISNITPPGASHDLGQVAAHSQWTFYNHV